jgi:RNA polymerase sigma-70 factor (ECF subfamily)
MTDDVSQSAPAGSEPARTSSEAWGRLFEDLARGRLAALDALYDLAAPKLYGLALWRTGSPEDAADVVHEVFVRLVEQGSRLAAVRNPKTWLLTVTRRAAVDMTRRRRRRRSEGLEACRYLVSDGSDPERLAEAARASALLAQLAPAQRDAVYLRHFAGCTFAEIGTALRVPTFTAASRYRNGILALRRLMGAENHEA